MSELRFGDPRPGVCVVCGQPARAEYQRRLTCGRIACERQYWKIEAAPESKAAEIVRPERS